MSKALEQKPGEEQAVDGQEARAEGNGKPEGVSYQGGLRTDLNSVLVPHPLSIIM